MSIEYAVVFVVCILHTDVLVSVCTRICMCFLFYLLNLYCMCWTHCEYKFDWTRRGQFAESWLFAYIVHCKYLYNLLHTVNIKRLFDIPSPEAYTVEVSWPL